MVEIVERAVLDVATGESKNKWNGELSHPIDMNGSFDITLSYEGKSAEEEILSTEPARIRLLWQNNPDATNQNRLYYGDNLPILAALMQHTTIMGKVQIVYIDPPFSTNSVFRSRSQKDAYADLLVGSQYVEFIRQRMIFLRELLADDGSIYVHLDGNMVFQVKIIMDEIFGRTNFRNLITRRKSNPKNYTRKTYGNISDYLLFYTKSDTYVWNRAYEPWTPERAAKEYQYVEEGSGRRYKKVPVHAPGERNGETGKPWRGMAPPPGKHWQYPPQTLDEMDARGEIYWSPSGNPRRKVYLDQSDGIPVQDIWRDVRDAHNQNIKITGYPTEKPVKLLDRIVQASSNPGTLVLDCFSGSGTTLAVASQLGRNWIGIDNSVEAIKTTLQRFRTGLKPMGDYVQKRQLPQTLPLFDLDEGTITDFALYAAEPYGNDLDEIIRDWQTAF